MACNCPVVSTKVGDVAWLLEDVEGCYIASPDIQEYKNRISEALYYAGTEKKTNGHQRLIELKLDSNSIAGKLIAVYQSITRTHETGSHNH
jgi:glycosyltransferase involved in cell wall biosynthesis